MSNSRRNKRNLKGNDVSLHCGLLVTDFFAFADGHAENVQCVFVEDISEPMPPSLENLRKMLARTNKAWRDYCDLLRLPSESRGLCLKRIETEWHRREKQELPKKSRSAKR